MVPPKTEPPEGEDPKPWTSNDTASKSFRDTVKNRPTPRIDKPRTDLRATGMISIAVEGDNISVTVDPTLIKKLVQPWQKALIVKLLGRDIGYITLRNRATEIWKPTGDFKLMDLGHGFFVVKFDDDSDRDKVVTEGPWLINGNYLAIRTWSQSFVPSKAAEDDSMMVWARFPELPLLYYDEDVLFAIASSIGKPVKVANRGRFARVCIEVDSLEPMVTEFHLDGNVQRVEFKGIDVPSIHCGCVKKTGSSRVF